MNLSIKSLASKILKSYFGSQVGSKYFNGTQHKFYYEKSQHLMFAFKNKITYEAIIQRKTQKFIKPGDTVFDIGGNIGQYTICFSDLVGKTGRVITLEPDFKNFSFLQLNVNVNHLTNVTCLNKGASETASTLKFFRDTDTGGRKSSFEPKFLEENFHGFTDEVLTVTLDELVKSYGEPALVKIDVEGFETTVLKGMKTKMKKAVFFVEVREDTKKEVFDFFAVREYSCFHIDHEMDVLIKNEVQIPGFANLLFIPKASPNL